MRLKPLIISADVPAWHDALLLERQLNMRLSAQESTLAPAATNVVSAAVLQQQYMNCRRCCLLLLLLVCAQDPDLREAAGMLQQALNAETVEEEERLWTEVRGSLGSADTSTAEAGARA